MTLYQIMYCGGLNPAWYTSKTKAFQEVRRVRKEEDPESQIAGVAVFTGLKMPLKSADVVSLLNKISRHHKRSEQMSKKYAEVVWTTDDVRTLFNISEDDADDWLLRNQNRIRDRLIELGWDVIQTLGDMDDLERCEELEIKIGEQG